MEAKFTFKDKEGIEYAFFVDGLNIANSETGFVEFKTAEEISKDKTLIAQLINNGSQSIVNLTEQAAQEFEKQKAIEIAKQTPADFIKQIEGLEIELENANQVIEKLIGENSLLKSKSK